MRDFLQYLRNNSLTYLVSIVVLLITFLITVMSMFMNSTINTTLKNMEDSVQIVAYVPNDVSTFKVENLKKELYKIGNINGVEHNSSEEELEDFLEGLSVGNDLFLEVLEDNPLDDSLNITLKDTRKIESTYKEILELEDFTEDTLVYNKDGVDIIENLTQLLYVVNIVLIVVIALVTIPIINLIIKGSIDNRSNEIRVKRLIGAKKISILTPIILELLVMFLISAIIYSIVSYYLLVNARKLLEGLHISAIEVGSLTSIYVDSLIINGVFGLLIITLVMLYVSRKKIRV